jgi:hypothetical protein
MLFPRFLRVARIGGGWMIAVMPLTTDEFLKVGLRAVMLPPLVQQGLGIDGFSEELV